MYVCTCLICIFITNGDIIGQTHMGLLFMCWLVMCTWWKHMFRSFVHLKTRLSFCDVKVPCNLPVSSCLVGGELHMTVLEKMKLKERQRPKTTETHLEKVDCQSRSACHCCVKYSCKGGTHILDSCKGGTHVLGWWASGFPWASGASGASNWRGQGWGRCVVCAYSSRNLQAEIGS